MNAFEINLFLWVVFITTFFVTFTIELLLCSLYDLERNRKKGFIPENKGKGEYHDYLDATESFDFDENLLYPFSPKFSSIHMDV